MQLFNQFLNNKTNNNVIIFHFLFFHLEIFRSSNTPNRKMDHPHRNCLEKFADLSQKLVKGPNTNLFNNTIYKSTCIFMFYI